MVDTAASQIASLTPKVSADTKRLATRDNLDAAGQRFEAIFTGMMLKSMRAAKLADDLFDSKALDTFRDMQDQKVAETMASHAPIGIGKAMVEFLARADAALQADPAAAPDSADSSGNRT
ncbi:flagellar protein FlgJ [Hephaestia caeni]|uniref:Flagellar protein FlgJ n=1 Tax=Hephaestia caeni TaxID=645617 RepID=A0A397P837_9SPHN|nr:rod-binding protein [Hephaestia caeni]RIA44493.1 flagellar protein FlgJ [Hephaestia caeni]